MRQRAACGAILLTAVLYVSIAWSYAVVITASSQRTTELVRASVEDRRFSEEASHLERLQGELGRKLKRLRFAGDSRGFDILLQRVARVALRSHVAIVGLVPDPGDARGVRPPFAGRILVIRLRARFAGALQFLRLLPAAGVLLRVGDVAFSQPVGTGAPGAPLEVTLRVTLLHFVRDPRLNLKAQ